MPLDELLTTAQLGALFGEEVTAAGGAVSETFDDGIRLFTRCTLDRVRVVQPGDTLRAGVALRASATDVRVHPYVFRQVCRNGAIVAHSLHSCQIDTNDFITAEEGAGAVRAAVRACCQEEAFAEAAEGMRTAGQQPADVGLNVLAALSRLPPHVGTHLFRMVVERFFTGDDHSRYGLLNAVTSVARDTTDPEIRWGLEEFGGGMAVGRTECSPPGRPARPQARSRSTEPSQREAVAGFDRR